jgi:hypothetical protein
MSIYIYIYIHIFRSIETLVGQRIKILLDKSECMQRKNFPLQFLTSVPLCRELWSRIQLSEAHSPHNTVPFSEYVGHLERELTAFREWGT